MRTIRPIAERFAAQYVPVPESGCWLWIGSTCKRGYGRIGERFADGSTRQALAHRVSLELVGRPVPKGMQACHHCDTPSCVNPDHLFIGTAADNSADMRAKGRAIQGAHYLKRTHCNHGHEWNEENTIHLTDGHGRACRPCRVAKKKAQILRNKSRNTTQPQEGNPQ